MAPKRHRWPLWKRSLWHALKSLVRNNPRAALSAAGAGTAYAIKGAAEEVHDALTTPATIPEKKRDKATFDEKAEFVESLPPAERKALAQIKSKAPLPAAPAEAPGEVSPHERPANERKKESRENKAAPSTYTPATPEKPESKTEPSAKPAPPPRGPAAPSEAPEDLPTAELKTGKPSA